jgi:mannose-6-phosphate isomerase-like protein (cupin superfamily)
MAHPGDVLLHPISGRRLTFRRTAAQTSGRVLEYTLRYPGVESPPDEHAHADQEHQLEVLDGCLQVSLSGRTQRLEPGEVLLVPAGKAHAVWNPFEVPTRAVWHTFPARDTEARLEAEWLPEKVR